MPKPPSQAPNTQVTPAPALEKRMRRTYKTEYKMKIIAQADACKHGELGALLRQEKLYSNQLSAWRSELKNGGIARL
jgi:transposase